MREVVAQASRKGERLVHIMALVLGGLFGEVAAEAQGGGQGSRIGHLTAFNMDGANSLRDTFRQGLRDFGHVESRNLVLKIRSAEGRHERYHALAAEAVALR